MNSFYSEEELAQLGLKSYGKNVRISRKTSIYGVGNISLGSNVRIDDFCILSGNITVGDYVHVAAYAALFAGDAGIVVGDFCGISSRTTIYAVTDDYSGELLTNPTIPNEFKHIISGRVTLCKHALIGASCVVLPGVTLGEGCSFGSMSLINKSADAWTINFGIPSKPIKPRSKKLLLLEEELYNG